MITNRQPLLDVWIAPAGGRIECLPGSRHEEIVCVIWERQGSFLASARLALIHIHRAYFLRRVN